MYLVTLGILYVVLSGLAISMNYRDQKWYPVVKPIPMVINIVLVAAALVSTGEVPYLESMILAGLVAGVTGDILLTLDTKYFIFGLAAFLLGHLLYLAGLLFGVTGFTLYGTLAPLGLAAVYGIIIVRFMKNAGLQLPVLLYLLVITLMLIIAIHYDLSRWGYLHLFSAGAILFVISDALLAWDRFIRSFRLASLLVLGAYYSAQFLVTLAVVLPRGLQILE
jgi:uncharacterized membrane protein YhhN